MRVAVIGSAFAGNKGASAMLESSVQQLTKRDRAAFVLLSTYPSEDARLNPYRNVRILDAKPLRLGLVINSAALLHRLLPPLRRTIESVVPEVRALAQADVLLDQGGITFVDGRGKFLIYNIASILPALVMGVPVVKCAQALGPFEEPLNRAAAKALLPRVTTIVSRGAITHEHLESLGLTNVVRGADMAFGLEVGPDDEAGARRLVDVGFFDGGDVVGISRSAVLRKTADAVGGDYVAEVRRMIDHVTETLGRPVFLVPHSARTGTTKSHNNDLPVCREIYAGVASPDRVLFPDLELTSQELRYLIGRCDVFVASRFHAMVSSLATTVPTLVIGWSHKYREVLDMFGQARWAMGYDEYSDDVFVDRLAELLGSRDTVRAELAQALPGVRRLALEQIGVIEDVAAGRR